MNIGDIVYRKIDPMKQAIIVVGYRYLQNDMLLITTDIQDEILYHFPFELELISKSTVKVSKATQDYFIGDQVYVGEDGGYITAIDQLHSGVLYDVSIKGKPIACFDFELNRSPAYES